MYSMLWIIPALPLGGFIVLALFGARMHRASVSWVGVGSVAFSAIVTILIAGTFLSSSTENEIITQHLWTWMHVGTFSADIALHIDSLSLLMCLVVTVIGSLIHVYSIGYMADDPGYARFFAYMNLFVAAMLTLVLADNLLLLFLGWEGVGLCSYLLIGFWYDDPKNGRAATKAFLVTRAGDAAMTVGLLLLISHFGTLHIATILERAPEQWAVGTAVPTLAAVLLLGGALGKSGQLPLHVWLPDAMAGPTPVSALIHAATMVTAGVYLIARMHAIFELAPAVQFAIAIIGAATLLMAGTCALVQRDIKRVLAYSTISQIGYMFLALGVGAWSAAMFHFMTHAIFKALLFMAAGAVIVALHHEQDMFKMGGLRKPMPFVFGTFLIGAISLAALPLVTAGFYSKDLILYEVWMSPSAGRVLWLAGIAGAAITALYTFRMVFMTFFGEQKTHLHVAPGKTMTMPLAILAAGACVAGFIETPATLGGFHVFCEFMQQTLPPAAEHTGGVRTELILQVISGGVVLLGIATAYFLWCRKSSVTTWLAAGRRGRAAHEGLGAGWYFDALYARAIADPYRSWAQANRNDAVDYMYALLAFVAKGFGTVLGFTQTGHLRWYAFCMGLGACIAILLVVYL